MTDERMRDNNSFYFLSCHEQQHCLALIGGATHTLPASAHLTQPTGPNAHLPLCNTTV
jgi:hypothetical protein